MVDFTLRIKVSPNWVEHLARQNLKICFAMSSQSAGSSKKMNVIAYSENVAPNIEVHWTDRYAIAAAKTGFSAGSKINTSYQPLQIRFGQAFVLREWDNFAVSDDKDAPNNGFLFKNKHPAAAVLYGVVNGRDTPVYITAEDIYPSNNTASLTPQSSVAIWLQRDGSAGTMFNPDSVNLFVIPMTTPTMSVKYEMDGRWVITS